jgi:PhnB protein
MASRLNPYIQFQDTAQEALTFYQSVLGGELNVMRFSEFGGPAEIADLVMHGQLETPAGFTLMASDTPPGMDRAEIGGITISLSGDDVADLRGWFDGLAEGGAVNMPLEKQMWGDVFGQLTDRFGVSWLVNISGEAAEAAEGSQA